MSKDLLAEATRALRETESASELEARATRARVMSGLHQARVRRRTRHAFLLPIAATFVAASAWGAASGKAQLMWASIERMTHRSASALARAPSNPSKSAIGALRPPLPPPQPLAPEPNPASEPNPAVPTPSPLHAASASSARPNGSEAALALYRAAHTAHFVDHNPARALAAWDAYLAAAPNGAFAPEAHYNRALSLVRLGRNSEAVSALEPFASGAYGGYRQAEAAALLERLGP